jgi:hypothetical protein
MQKFSGNVLVADHDKVIYEGLPGYGQNTPGISFPIATISRILVAIAMLPLREKSKLQISDPVIRTTGNLKGNA